MALPQENESEANASPSNVGVGVLVFEPRCLPKVEVQSLEIPLDADGKPMKDKAKVQVKVTYIPECGHIEVRHPAPTKGSNEVEPATTPRR